jgi:hypothetical protein
MEQIPQFAWPLFGVLLGWLLSALSSGWKSRLERKKVIGKLLTSLLDVRSDVKAIRTASTHMKDLIRDPDEYESFRQYLSATYLLNHGANISNLAELTADLSTYKPVEAFQLNALLKLLVRSKGAQLTATAKHPEAYERVLCLHETGLDMADEQLTKTVRSLALSHGLLTRFALTFQLRKSDSVGPSNEKFLGSSAKEIMEQLRTRA